MKETETIRPGCFQPSPQNEEVCSRAEEEGCEECLWSQPDKRGANWPDSAQREGLAVGAFHLRR